MPAQSKRQKEQAEKTRRRIITYAGRVFFERGFRKVTIEELCAGMAVSKRTFYKHFANRDELIEAVVAENMAQTGIKIIENLQSDLPVAQILDLHFDLLINHLFKNISMQFIADIQILMPELWQRIDKLRSQIGGLLGELIRRGQQQGAIHECFDPDVAGRLFQGILTNVANPAVILGLGLNFEQVINTFRHLLMHGLLTQPEKE